MRSLRSLFVTSSIFVSTIGFIIFIVAGSYFFEKIALKKSLELSETLSKQTFNSMYQIMKKGWSRDELQEFIDATNSAFLHSSIDVHIYRSALVSELYGDIENAKPRSNDIEIAFKNGEFLNIIDDLSFSYIYPIKAQNECLSCHTNAKSGEILGVIETSQDIGKILDETKFEFYIFLLILSPLPVAISFFVAYLANRKIDKSASLFRDRIKEINSVVDLKKLDCRVVDFGFSELNSINNEIISLSSKLQNIAADKDLLEFEVKLLDKFIITSEIVKDWKEHIKNLINEINKIMEVYTLFVIFKVDDEGYDLEIFWINEPTLETKKMFEESVRAKIVENPYFTNSSLITINHNLANKEGQLKELTQKDIELQTKSLIMSTPKIGGVVGIGVQSQITQDSTRYIVIESILTTLINVIGSIKAIYKYTKDLEYYATRDPLTNLFNQRVFRELLQSEIGRAKRYGQKFALLIMDFDNFKFINDSYGHDFGDRFLQFYSQLLRRAIRDEDMLARYGGDEFVVVLPNADVEQVYLIANKIKEIFEKNSLKSIEDESINATVSMGVAIYPDHGRDEKELFMIADNMMFKSKKSGKNRISIPTQDDIKESFRLAGEKTKVVLDTLEEQSVVPYFQPILPLKQRCEPIFELLMRIPMGSKILNATEFIGVSDNLGITHRLDYILINKAFEMLKSVDFKGLIFINLSPKALIIGEFLTTLKDIGAKNSIEPHQIVLEIAEKDILRNITLLDKFISEVKFEKFKFAIDNFGSSVSSFNHIKQLPIDYIKIDGEYIRNIKKDRKNIAYIKSIITLAKELGIYTIAEFVEDREIFLEIEHLGIDFAQGYYIGRPDSEIMEIKDLTKTKDSDG